MKIISAALLFLFSAGAFFISFRSFQEKGFLFNNAWIYASKEERCHMKKTPHYRQSALVFLLCGMIFLLLAADALWHIKGAGYILFALVIITVIYAIVSGIVIEGKKEK